MLIAGLLFYVFSFVIVLSGLAVILVRNPVHSVLLLILCFFSAAGIFMLLGAEFIAMVTIIVYVGAVAVLFLFVVMMLNINFVKLKEGFSQYLPLCIMIALILLIDLYVVIDSSVNKTDLILAKAASAIPDYKTTTNTHAIGSILYTDYFFPFQIAGFILLVAMIGAITLTIQTKKNVKKQNVTEQTMRDPKDCIELANPQSGKGIS